MSLENFMSRNLSVISANASIREAAKQMDDVNVGCLPVCEGDHLVGIITDRDIIIRSISAGQDPNIATVRDAMTSPVVYCFEEEGIESVVKLMREKDVRRVAILNRDKRLIGICSEADLRRLKKTEFELKEKTATPSNRSSFLELIGGLIAGASAMYILDARAGRRRRKIVRDKLYHYFKTSSHFADKKSRHIKNVLRGKAAELRSSILSSEKRAA